MSEHRPPGTLAAAWLVARKDLAIEFRTRTAFLSALVFAVLAIAIFYFTWDESIVTAGGSRARGALGGAHVLGAARTATFVRPRGARSRHRRAARLADQPRVDLPRQGDREPDLSDRGAGRRDSGAGAVLQSSARTRDVGRVRDRAAGDDRHRRRRYAVQRHGGEHAARRAAAADAEPAVLRARVALRRAGGDGGSRRAAASPKSGRG